MPKIFVNDAEDMEMTIMMRTPLTSWRTCKVLSLSNADNDDGDNDDNYNDDDNADNNDDDDGNTVDADMHADCRMPPVSNEA